MSKDMIRNTIAALMIVVALAGCSGNGPQPTQNAPAPVAPPASTHEGAAASPSGVVEHETAPVTEAPEEPTVTPAGDELVVTSPLPGPYVPGSSDSVDVVYFETSNPCSCMAEVGDAVEYAILTNFQAELQSGELRFFLLVSNAPDNMDLVKQLKSQPFDLFVIAPADAPGTVEPVYELWSLTGNREAIVEFMRELISATLQEQR